jgi:cell division protein FtsL
MNNYVSTLETKVKIQDEEIDTLKESNKELSGSNRMMSSRIDMLQAISNFRHSIECLNVLDIL